MKEERDYIKDISEMRLLMERSSKFLSFPCLAGIMAGIYALVGAYIAYRVFDFNPDKITYTPAEIESQFGDFTNLMLLAASILVLAISTVVFISLKKADKKGEKPWNPVARRFAINMIVPLTAGGLLILIMISKGMIGLLAPFTLIFYGLALYNASKFSYDEVKSFGLIQVALGLVATYFVEYGLLIWTLGFGLVNIIYGVYLHYRYER